jgi:hypothetical protein
MFLLPDFEIGFPPLHTLLIVICQDCLLWIGTNLVRPRERFSGNWGIGGTVDAELERWIGCLKPSGIVGDGIRRFRFPASPQLTRPDLPVRVVENALNE